MEYLQSKTLEECPSFNVGAIGKTNKEKSLYGNYSVLNGNYRFEYDFRLNPDKDQASVVFCKKRLENNEKMFSRNQEIVLDYVKMTFGNRPYLVCSLCMRRYSKLYYRDEHTNFLYCRKCLKLRYDICNINKKTHWGALLYAMQRHITLQGKMEPIKRIVYADKITKKAKSFAKQAHKLLSVKNREQIDRALDVLRDRACG